MRKFLTILVSLYYCIGHVYAQSISGKIIDDTGSPLVAATVEVLASRDSTHIAGTAADLNGSYKFDIAAGSYIIRTSYVGYTSVQKRIILFNNHNLHPATQPPAKVPVAKLQVTESLLCRFSCWITCGPGYVFEHHAHTRA